MDAPISPPPPPYRYVTAYKEIFLWCGFFAFFNHHFLPSFAFFYSFFHFCCIYFRYDIGQRTELWENINYQRPNTFYSFSSFLRSTKRRCLSQVYAINNTVNTTNILRTIRKLYYSGDMLRPIFVTFRPSSNIKVRNTITLDGFVHWNLSCTWHIEDRVTVCFCYKEHCLLSQNFATSMIWGFSSRAYEIFALLGCYVE
jgi:hypothetical protein